MSDNTAILERVSKILGVPQKELVRKGLEGLLQTQLRTCSAEINEIKTKYNVKTAAELEKKIQNGNVEEHPAWEDVILLENLEERIKSIRKELTALRHE
ncbi:MAG: hypothetical protein NWE98_02545 [Candidatus Bathyarchaeota archaeon]|nr:hypothetical protein [Candidatus Bathyarchaeota archaeon]